MSTDAWLALGTVVGVFGILISGKWPAYLALLAGLIFLMITRVLSIEGALVGFSNPGMITVAVLFVVAAGLRQTGTLAFLLRRVLGRPRSVRQAHLRLALPVIGSSAFLNNTPLVAMLLPVVQDWCRLVRVPPSKLLLPLSYFAILGGVVTLIGTSTNLVVDGMMVARGESSLGLFGITAVGLPCAVAGSVYLVIFGSRMLPDRSTPVPRDESPREYTLEFRVAPNSSFDGKNLSATGLTHVPGLQLTELRRVDGSQVVEPASSEVMRVGDRLVFVGVLDGVLDVLRTPGLVVATSQLTHLNGHPTDRCYVEAVVSRTSPLLARNVRDVRFRELYSAVVLGVSRNGQRLRAPIEDVDFRPGDALLLEAHRDFVERHRNTGAFSLASRIEGEGPATNSQAPIAGLILLGMVLLAGFGVMPMLHAAALAAAAMLLTRCCSEETARASIDWPLLLAIGAAFGLGRALEETGVARMLAHTLLRFAGEDPWLSLVVIYGTTALVTEFVTNNAAAVMVFPIAMATAEALGVNHVPFVVAVMIAASASFVTPLGYQTNLMVYGPGGYRFSDFFKIGIPMMLMLWIITVVLAPLVYGF